MSIYQGVKKASIGETVEQWESSSHKGGSMGYNHLGEQWLYQAQLNIFRSYDPTTLISFMHVKVILMP